MIEVGDKFIAREGMKFVNALNELDTILHDGFANDLFEIALIHNVREVVTTTCGRQFFLKDVNANLVPKIIRLPAADLPMPYSGPMDKGQTYWMTHLEGLKIDFMKWTNLAIESDWRARGCIHLSEANAQKWVDWWKEIVVGQIQVTSPKE